MPRLPDYPQVPPASADLVPLSDASDGMATKNTTIADLVALVGALAGSDKTYRHVQSAPASVWTVTHGLGKRVSVTAVDSSGRAVVGDVAYVSDNQVTLTFSAAFSGEAYCN